MRELSRLRNKSIWKTAREQHVYVQHGVGDAVSPKQNACLLMRNSLKLVVCLSFLAH